MIQISTYLVLERTTDSHSWKTPPLRTENG
jgi:hypothetical protein